MSDDQLLFSSLSTGNKQTNNFIHSCTHTNKETLERTKKDTVIESGGSLTE